MKLDKKGFTLIELLVVIAIIGLLSTMAVYAINVARMKSRDARRLADMRQIQTALNLYHDDHGEWPEENPTDGTWEDSYENGGDFINALKNNGYMNEVPVDPINTSSSGYYYSYHVYPAGYRGCSLAEGEFYVLGIRNMETFSGNHPSSPGWSCPDRNWQGGFTWVTGAFE